MHTNQLCMRLCELCLLFHQALSATSGTPPNRYVYQPTLKTYRAVQQQHLGFTQASPTLKIFVINFSQKSLFQSEHVQFKVLQLSNFLSPMQKFCHYFDGCGANSDSGEWQRRPCNPRVIHTQFHFWSQKYFCHLYYKAVKTSYHWNRLSFLNFCPKRLFSYL